MRYVLSACICLLSLHTPASAHSETETRWVLPDYDGDALVACAASVDSPECQARLYPCETAFGLPVDGDLAALPEPTRHDLTACYMALADLYEVALWNIEPGSDPDPMIARKANKLFNNIMFRHHRNATGACQSEQEEKTEDWRCEAQAFQARLIEAEAE